MTELTRRVVLTAAAGLAGCASIPLPMMNQAREGRVVVEGGSVVWRRFENASAGRPRRTRCAKRLSRAAGGFGR